MLGWAHLGSHVVVAVELCPQKAQILAEILQVPCVQASQLRPHHLEQSVVIQGDVRDPTWFHVSLVLPAKLVLWSAPCVTWSAGGRLRGLSAEEGLLLPRLHWSLRVVFTPDFVLGRTCWVWSVTQIGTLSVFLLRQFLVLTFRY